MTTLPEMRDLAQRLLTHESDRGDTSESAGSATLRVYEKLRKSLSELTGVAGFQSLASRALTLAKLEDHSLGSVRVAADGHFEDMNASEPSIEVEKDRVHAGGVILISRLLGLLFIFLGEALTLSLLRDAWPGVASDDRNSGNGRKS